MKPAARRARELQARLRDELKRSGVLDSTRSVLVAVSGGLDSVCLLHLLRFSEIAPRVIAAHYDHRMRVNSDEDAAWVRGLCRAWSVPLTGAQAATPAASEAAARAQRYRFLERVADEQQADFIATGHHADDQAETVLFRLARGTGLTGLAGIAERRGRIVRPFLRVSRVELVAYAGAYGLSWRDDPSNRDIRYARNFIRWQVLPVLEQLRPGAARRIAALAARAAEAESAWDDVVQQAVQDVVTDRVEHTLTLARERLLVYHPHVRARVMRHLLRQLGSSPGRAGTRIALRFVASGASGTHVVLTNGIVLRREFDRLLLGPAPAIADAADVSLEICSAAAGSGSFQTGGRHYVAQWVPVRRDVAESRGHTEPERPDESSWTASFDPAALRFPLELRGWRPGDRIRLRYGSKKLKELFRERRIGRAARSRMPVLQDADGRVLWAIGVARGQDTQHGPDDNGLRISVADADSS